MIDFNVKKIANLQGIDLEMVDIPHLMDILLVNVLANSKNLKLADLLLAFLTSRYVPKVLLFLALLYIFTILQHFSLIQLISSGCGEKLQKIVDSVESSKKKILNKFIEKLCA